VPANRRFDDGRWLIVAVVVVALVAPAKPARFVTLDLPKLETAADLVKAAAVITAEVGAGRLALEDVGPLVALIESAVNAIQTHDHAERIAALEHFVEDRRLRVIGANHPT
jgi:hypothetical protein